MRRIDREIRKIEKSRSLVINIIGLSAHAVAEREQMAYDAGMDLYLTKPVQIDDIKKVLLDVEQGARAAEEDQPT